MRKRDDNDKPSKSVDINNENKLTEQIVEYKGTPIEFHGESLNVARGNETPDFSMKRKELGEIMELTGFKGYEQDVVSNAIDTVKAGGELSEEDGKQLEMISFYLAKCDYPEASHAVSHLFKSSELAVKDEAGESYYGVTIHGKPEENVESNSIESVKYSEQNEILKDEIANKEKVAQEGEASWIKESDVFKAMDKSLLSLDDKKMVSETIDKAKKGEPISKDEVTQLEYIHMQLAENDFCDEARAIFNLYNSSACAVKDNYSESHYDADIALDRLDEFKEYKFNCTIPKEKWIASVKEDGQKWIEQGLITQETFNTMDEVANKLNGNAIVDKRLKSQFEKCCNPENLLKKSEYTAEGKMITEMFNQGANLIDERLYMISASDMFRVLEKAGISTESQGYVCNIVDKVVSGTEVTADEAHEMRELINSLQNDSYDNVSECQKVSYALEHLLDYGSVAIVDGEFKRENMVSGATVEGQDCGIEKNLINLENPGLFEPLNKVMKKWGIEWEPLKAELIGKGSFKNTIYVNEETKQVVSVKEFHIKAGAEASIDFSPSAFKYDKAFEFHTPGNDFRVSGIVDTGAFRLLPGFNLGEKAGISPGASLEFAISTHGMIVDTSKGRVEAYREGFRRIDDV